MTVKITKLQNITLKKTRYYTNSLLPLLPIG